MVARIERTNLKNIAVFRGNTRPYTFPAGSLLEGKLSTHSAIILNNECVVVQSFVCREAQVAICNNVCERSDTVIVAYETRR